MVHCICFDMPSVSECELAHVPVPPQDPFSQMFPAFTLIVHNVAQYKRPGRPDLMYKVNPCSSKGVQMKPLKMLRPVPELHRNDSVLIILRTCQSPLRVTQYVFSSYRTSDTIIIQAGQLPCTTRFYMKTWGEILSPFAETLNPLQLLGLRDFSFVRGEKGDGFCNNILYLHFQKNYHLFHPQASTR